MTGHCVCVCEVLVEMSVCRIGLCHISVPSLYCTNLFLYSPLLSLPLSLLVFVCVRVCVSVCVQLTWPHVPYF